MQPDSPSKGIAPVKRHSRHEYEAAVDETAPSILPPMERKAGPRPQKALPTGQQQTAQAHVHEIAATMHRIPDSQAGSQIVAEVHHHTLPSYKHHRMCKEFKQTDTTDKVLMHQASFEEEAGR
ncbi:hypothetical protein Ciccas_014372, partial [Cichlidogyrus casuarinus]